MTRYYDERLVCFLCRGRVFAQTTKGGDNTYFYQCESCGLDQIALVYEDSPWFEETMTPQLTMTEISMLLHTAKKEQDEYEYGTIIWAFWNGIIVKLSGAMKGLNID